MKRRNLYESNANATTSWSYIRKAWSLPFKQQAADRNSDAFYRRQAAEDDAAGDVPF